MYPDITLISIATMPNPDLHFRKSPSQNNDNDNNNNVISINKYEEVITKSDTNHVNGNATTSTSTAQPHHNGIALIKTAAGAEDKEEPKTPTSLDQRIPEIRPCPPAPKKVRMSICSKRKCSSPNYQVGRNHHDSKFGNKVIGIRSSASRRLLDFSKEVESMFPPMLQANLGIKIKKARTV